MPARRQQILAGVQKARPVTAAPKIGVGPAKPAQAAKGVGAASVAKPAPVNALPWDSISTLESAGTQRKSQEGLAEDASERDFKERYYGLGPGYDVNNPYSQAALLESQHINARRGDLNAAGNQLYAGSTINHLRGADSRYAQNRNALELQRQSDLSGLESKDRGFKQEAEEGDTNARIGAIERLEKRELEPQPKKVVKKTNNKSNKKGGKK